MNWGYGLVCGMGRVGREVTIAPQRPSRSQTQSDKIDGSGGKVEGVLEEIAWLIEFFFGQRRSTALKEQEQFRRTFFEYLI